MSDQQGVHGTSGATNEHQPSAMGSLDTSLNSHTKSPRGPRRGRRWVIAVAAVAVVAIVAAVAFVIHQRSNAGSASAKASTSMSIGLKLAPTSLDIRRQSGSALDQLLIGDVYEGLVARDSKNAVVPALARSWDTSADGRTYTFHMRGNARFSNGDTLDAEDVVWSINELRNNQYQDAERLKDVTSVSAPDASTVSIQLDKPYADLLWVLTGRPGLVFDRDAKYDPATEAVGSGPYKITTYVPNSSVVLEANENYSGEHRAKTRRVVVRYLTDDTAAVNALKSGDVQVLAPLSENLAAPFAKDSEHYAVKVGDGTDKFVLAFNGKGPRTSDQRVRQAIRYAIDHRQLIASRGGSDTALGGPIPSLDPGYEDLTGLYPHDVTKAKQLMKEVGYDADHPLTLTLTYANIYGSELGDQLRSQLKPIGIDLHVEVVEFATWLQDVYTNHDYDLSLVDHNESHDFSSWSDPTYYFGYDNPTVRKLTEDASRATSSEQSERLLAQAARIVSQDAPADWLFNYRITTAYAAGVQGFPLNLNQTLMPLYNVTYTPGR